MLDSVLLLWLLVPLQSSVKRYFPFLCDLRCGHMHSLSVHSLLRVMQIAGIQSHMSHHILPHVDTASSSSQTLFFLIQQRHSQFPVSLRWEEWLSRASESKLSVSITSMAFRNSNADMLRHCKLAWHSKIVPLINNLKHRMVKWTGSLEGHKLYLLLICLTPAPIKYFFFPLHLQSNTVNSFTTFYRQHE